MKASRKRLNNRFEFARSAPDSQKRGAFASKDMTQKRIGLIAFVFGASSIPAAMAALYAKSLYGNGSSAVLDWLDARGFVTPTPNSNSVPSLSESSLFLITDERAISLLTILAMFLAIIAMINAIAAEYLREPTLYLSAGFICGALGLMLIMPLVGIGAMIGGLTITMLVRYGKGWEGRLTSRSRPTR